MNFSSVYQYLNQSHNIDFAIYDVSFFQKSMEKRLKITGCRSAVEYCDYMIAKPAEVQILKNSMRVHYSEFFREPLTFAVLEHLVLPEIIQKKIDKNRGEIRIWSAGCAAGQEPYSIAILLEEALRNTNHSINYRIFATDADEYLLEDARFGAYSSAALNNVSLKRAESWFTKQNDIYTVIPSIREHIDFSFFDLNNQEQVSPPASIFGDFDLVFCCNVLIYYQPKTRNLFLKKFTHSLAPRGTLVAGESERAIVFDAGYREIYPQSAIFRMSKETRSRL